MRGNTGRRLYAALLRLYPAAHRREYGPLMAQLFADLCCEAWQRGGRRALATLWLRTLGDTLRSATVEHASGWGRDLRMSHPIKPWSWRDVALAVLPGIVCFRALAPVRIESGRGGNYLFVIAILLLITGVSMVRRGHVAVWGLPLLGFMAHTAVIIGWAVLMGLLRAPFRWPTDPEPALLVVLLGALPVVAMVWMVRARPAARLWFIGVGVLLAIEMGLSNLIARGAWTSFLGGSFSLMGWRTLYPLMGYVLARRYGVTAVLFVLGGTSGLVTAMAVDPYALYGTPWRPILSGAIVAVFLIVAPLSVLRASHRRGVWLGALLPALIVMLAGGGVIVALKGFNIAQMALQFVRVLQMAATLGLALALYSTVQRPADLAELPPVGEMTDEGRSA